MNDRFVRDYWVVRLTPSAARLIVECMSNKTLERHAEKCLSDPYSMFKIEPVPEWICERNHAPLWISRWIESGMKIGKTRAHLKLPKGDEDRLVEFAGRLRCWAEAHPRLAPSLVRAADEIDRYATNHPLETLAEALDNL